MNRVTTLFNDGSTVPASFVTVGRQRVKQYRNSVYLNNGNEFEIELFNPTQNKVLAKIELNGVSLGAGIVLRPGERVFLERYLNESRKFLFETYEVDGNNPSVQKAIVNNGDVSVKFYNEQINYNYGITYTGGSCWGTISPSWPNTFTTSHSSLTNMTNPKSPISGRKFSKSTNLGAANDIASASVFYSSTGSAPAAGAQSLELEGSMSMNFVSPGISFEEKDQSFVETGRIDKGSHSNQGFTYDNTIFNSWWTWSSYWKILPMSQKPIMREDLVVYCPNCQAKRRKESHKFCPICGTQY